MITDPPGPIAGDIAGLWWVLLVLGGAVFALVLALIVIPLVRRRDGGEPGAADSEPAVSQRVANRWILGGGVLLPTLVLSVALAVSVDVMRDIPDSVPADGLVIEVVAQQFWWSVRYPDEGVTVPNEVHIPVGEPVEVRLTSEDVIHSFWVPELNGKVDALPDGTNRLVLLADEPGVYRGSCAEFCGLQHAKMGFRVVAEPPEVFTAWLADQASPAAAPSTAAAARGAEVFRTADCGSCHTIAGTAADGDDGPDLTHVASRQTLAAATIPNTTEDLSRWLRDPDSVKEGVEMPPTDLSDEDLADLVRYLEGLE